MLLTMANFHSNKTKSTVKFGDCKMKEVFLKSTRNKRVPATDTGFPSCSNPIYVNEQSYVLNGKKIVPPSSSCQEVVPIGKPKNLNCEKLYYKQFS